MSEQVSSPFQMDNREFEIMQRAFEGRVKKLKADAKRCKAMYEGKVSTETKMKAYLDEAEELEELESKIAIEFS